MTGTVSSNTCLPGVVRALVLGPSFMGAAVGGPRTMGPISRPRSF
jgi:hypothetical protein